MVSHCNLSNNRSLTKCLIQASNSALKPSHQFANTSEWTDGLDQWSFSVSEGIKKTNCSRHNLYFCPYLGIHIPRREKIKSARVSIPNGFVSSTSTSNNLFPKRLRQLLKKQKALLAETTPSDELASSSASDVENPPAVNTNQQCKSDSLHHSNYSYTDCH